MRQVIVIGAGQAGLSAAYYLQRQGLSPERDFLVLDSNEGPGGAWRHRWDSLTFGTAHNIHDLPGMELGIPDPTEPASKVVARYYGDYEQEFGLKVRRPVKVQTVKGQQGALQILTDNGTYTTRLLINATGTWDRPYWPHYPGRELFNGRQLHTRDFTSADEFRNRSVVVVGAGTSAVQFLLQLNDAGASTTWVTRTPPNFTERTFDAEWGRDVEHQVSARTKAGLPPSSVVSVTGLPLTDQYRAGIEAGILRSAGPLKRITETGIELDDGRTVPADAILWATGFRAALDHLAPLKLREPGGGIRMDGVRVLKDSRVLLVGYGSSASTLGATRAGRAAAMQAVRQLGAEVRLAG
ncbi:cation diffusion facilitator CzcD-associated flavoprotein CzcO [Arthrobacter pigmenti]|uniref:Cation diffusion facilitator CzcD-associated flavoprotein CzcO n=1 Tax=Arthrobacter pigmenti TaxID=271432 RepID=A0A846RYX5_9MICC|nr:NAD(P)-binding domain-containing protein [Arthrobacter pigmenti]NJC24166.1 cation diffusion facilitator CzcD-associated flavoprotein CzcO [Arthrobacter pigmenti]